MPNLSSLSAITTAATALSNLILVSPQSTVGYQPLNANNPDGSPSTAQLPDTFVFNYEGEQSAQLQSDITDHYVEQNYAVQDQIALKPEVISTHGFIGELNDVVPSLLAPVKAIADKLVVIGAYAPTVSITAELAYAEAFFAYQIAQNVANAAVSAWNSIGNLITGSNGQSVIGSNGLTPANSQNRQQTAFQQFYGWWANRVLFRIQTPWAVFENMAILNLRAIQDADTRMITDFEISFKMIRFAATVGGNSLTNIPQGFQGRAQSQSASPVDLGTSSPVPSDSLASHLA